MPSYIRDESGDFKPKKEFFPNEALSKLESLSKLNKILSDFNKLKIIYLLSLGELNVTQIANELKASQSLISHHLATLKKEDLVVGNRKSKMIYYSLSSFGKSLVDKFF